MLNFCFFFEFLFFFENQLKFFIFQRNFFEGTKIQPDAYFIFKKEFQKRKEDCFEKEIKEKLTFIFLKKKKKKKFEGETPKKKTKRVFLFIFFE